MQHKTIKQSSNKVAKPCLGIALILLSLIFSIGALFILGWFQDADRKQWVTMLDIVRLIGTDQFVSNYWWTIGFSLGGIAALAIAALVGISGFFVKEGAKAKVIKITMFLLVAAAIGLLTYGVTIQIMHVNQTPAEATVNKLMYWSIAGALYTVMLLPTTTTLGVLGYNIFTK